MLTKSSSDLPIVNFSEELSGLTSYFFLCGFFKLSPEVITKKQLKPLSDQLKSLKKQLLKMKKKVDIQFTIQEEHYKDLKKKVDQSSQLHTWFNLDLSVYIKELDKAYLRGYIARIGLTDRNDLIEDVSDAVSLYFSHLQLCAFLAKAPNASIDELQQSMEFLLQYDNAHLKNQLKPYKNRLDTLLNEEFKEKSSLPLKPPIHVDDELTNKLVELGHADANKSGWKKIVSEESKNYLALVRLSTVLNVLNSPHNDELKEEILTDNEKLKTGWKVLMTYFVNVNKSIEMANDWNELIADYNKLKSLLPTIKSNPWINEAEIKQAQHDGKRIAAVLKTRTEGKNNNPSVIPKSLQTTIHSPLPSQNISSSALIVTQTYIPESSTSISTANTIDLTYKQAKILFTICGFIGLDANVATPTELLAGLRKHKLRVHPDKKTRQYQDGEGNQQSHTQNALKLYDQYLNEWFQEADKFSQQIEKSDVPLSKITIISAAEKRRFVEIGKSTRENFEELYKYVIETVTNTSLVENCIEDNEKWTQKITAMINDFKKEITQRVDELNEANSSFQTRVTQFSSGVTQLSSDVTQFSYGVTQFSSDLKQMSATIEQVEANLSRLNEHIQNAEKCTENLENKPQDLDAEHASLDESTKTENRFVK